MMALSDIAAHLMSIVNKCILQGSKHKLPSAAQAAIWSTFHSLRTSKQLQDKWDSFTATHVPVTYHQEPQLFLQLVIDRMLKKIIKNKAEGGALKVADVKSSAQITDFQSNAIRYMAGYIAVKLLKKYRKQSKNPKVQLKRKLFIRVLRAMKPADLPGQPDSPLDYTKVWTELIDRGGLYHVSDCVYNLFESIEVVVCRHINTETYTPGSDIRKIILEEALSSPPITFLWENVAQAIPTKYEKYSIELLTAIIDLWIMIRGHAFAKEWTMKSERKYKKATRKELKAKKNE